MADVTFTLTAEQGAALTASVAPATLAEYATAVIGSTADNVIVQGKNDRFNAMSNADKEEAVATQETKIAAVK